MEENLFEKNQVEYIILCFIKKDALSLLYHKMQSDLITLISVSHKSFFFCF